MNTTTETTTRPIYEIAREIRKDWGAKLNYAAKPYLDAMSCLGTTDDKYGLDSAKDIIARFLCNAGTYRGETAKRIKAELKKLAGIK